MKIAMVFPGYGSQFVGMAKELYDESRLIQEYFEEASNCLNINFVKLCFASSEQELAKMDFAYESIFLVSSSIAALLEQEGIRPDVVAGFGLGEYSAICAAGGLSLPDGLYFLSKYAQFYQELLSSLNVRAIRVQGLSCAKLQKICKAISTEPDFVSIGTRLADDDSIVTGIVEPVQQVEEKVRTIGAKILEMPLEMGLHSTLMLPVVEQLGVYLEKVDFKNLMIPLIESLDAKTLLKGDRVRYFIMKKINHMVRWDKVIDALEPYDIILEIGPGTTVNTQIANRFPNKQILTVNKPNDINSLKDILLAGKSID